MPCWTGGLWGCWLRMLALSWTYRPQCCQIYRAGAVPVQAGYEGCDGAAPPFPCDEVSRGSVRWMKAPLHSCPLPRKRVITQWLLVVSHLDLDLNFFLDPTANRLGFGIFCETLASLCPEFLLSYKKDTGAALNLEIFSCWDIFHSSWSDRR